jgi:trehalose 6-phosphate synthase/phosphatase
LKSNYLATGLVVPKVLATWPKALVIAAGDDETDEYLFRELPEESLSFCVGAHPSAARFTLSGVAALRSLLRDATRAARAARQR